ncbi:MULTISPECIES: hypothetical protein [unclassified Streptomyces]|uniref:hypothetical protein n=1 Tax=unclassified Streptomyces TaxID=2593676 RepID=UPI0036FE1B03
MQPEKRAPLRSDARRNRERILAAALTEPTRSADAPLSAITRKAGVGRGALRGAVNLALRFYAGQQEREARVSRHFERAREWGAVEDAERLHRAEKHGR